MGQAIEAPITNETSATPATTWMDVRSRTRTETAGAIARDTFAARPTTAKARRQAGRGDHVRDQAQRGRHQHGDAHALEDADEDHHGWWSVGRGDAGRDQQRGHREAAGTGQEQQAPAEAIEQATADERGRQLRQRRDAHQGADRSVGPAGREQGDGQRSHVGVEADPREAGSEAQAEHRRRGLERERVGGLGVDTEVGDGRGRLGRLHASGPGQLREHGDHDVTGVDLEEAAQRLAGVGAAHAVGAEGGARAARARSGRSGRARLMKSVTATIGPWPSAEQRGVTSGVRGGSVGVQAVPALGRQRLLAQPLVAVADHSSAPTS